MQVADIYVIARRLFLKRKITRKHKRELIPTRGTTILVRAETKPKPIPIRATRRRTQTTVREDWWAARARVTFSAEAPSRAAHSERGDGVDKAARGGSTGVQPRQWLLAINTPQSPNEPIGSELGRGVRVVVAAAAVAGALFSGAQVVFGQMVAPEAGTEHRFGRPSARTRLASAHPQRG